MPVMNETQRMCIKHKLDADHWKRKAEKLQIQVDSLLQAVQDRESEILSLKETLDNMKDRMIYATTKSREKDCTIRNVKQALGMAR